MADELDVSNKDAFLLASLALQAQKGDFDSAVHKPETLAKEQLIPKRNMKDIAIDGNVAPEDLG